MLGWDEAIAEFRKKAAEFQSAYNFLLDNGSQFNNAELLNKRQTLLSSGNAIKTTIETATKAIDSVQGVLKDVGDFIGLNALPALLPIAVVTGAVAAISYWLNQFDALRAEIYQDLIESGKTPEQAAQIVQTIRPAPGGLSSVASSILPLVAGAAFLWWVTKNYA